MTIKVAKDIWNIIIQYMKPKTPSYEIFIKDVTKPYDFNPYVDDFSIPQDSIKLNGKTYYNKLKCLEDLINYIKTELEYEKELKYQGLDKVRLEELKNGFFVDINGLNSNDIYDILFVKRRMYILKNYVFAVNVIDMIDTIEETPCFLNNFLQRASTNQYRRPEFMLYNSEYYENKKTVNYDIDMEYAPE